MHISISDENFYKNCKKHPVIIPSYYAMYSFVCVITLIFMVCSIIAPVNAIETQTFTVSIEPYPAITTSSLTPSSGSGHGGNITIATYNSAVLNFAALKEIRYDTSTAFTVPAGYSTSDYSLDCIIYYSYTQVGTAKIYYDYQSGSGTTYYYKVALKEISITNPGGIGGKSSSFVSSHLVVLPTYTDGRSLIHPAITYSSNYYTGSYPSAYLQANGYGYGTSGGFTHVNVRSSSFKNIGTAIKDDSGIITYEITRSGVSPYGGASYVNVSDTSGLLSYETSSSTTNITGISYNAPISFKIIDYNTGTIFYKNLFSSNYTAMVNPNEIALSQNASHTLISTTSTLNGIIFYEVDDVTGDLSNSMMLSSNTLYYHNYLKNTSGYWNAYQTSGTGGYYYNMGTSIPNNIVLSFTKPGNRLIRTKIIDSAGNEFTSYNNVTVSGAGSYSLVEYPIDRVTGDFVSGATVSIKNMQTKTWTNKTVYVPEDCEFLVSTGFYTAIGNAAGYLEQNEGQVYVGTSDVIKQIKMIPTGKKSSGYLPNDTGNVTLILSFVDNNGMKPISGAYGTLDDDITEVTSYTGSAIFYNVTNNTQHKIRFTAQGYNSVTEYFTPDSDPYLETIVSDKGTGTVVTYYTPIPTTVTPIYTVSVTQTGIGGTAINQTPFICGQHDGTIISKFLSDLDCNGIHDRFSQNLALACIICIIFILIGSRYGKGLGAAFGGIAGFVISLAMSLIPFWVFAALIVVGVLALAILAIFRGQT